MDSPTHRPAPGQPGGRTFLQKLAIYLTGLSIGLMMFGWFQYRKGLAVKTEQARQAENAEQPGNASDADTGTAESTTEAASEPRGVGEPADSAETAP